MSSYTYTPTTWANGGAPGISAANLQNIETGVSNAATYKLDKDGSTVPTAAIGVIAPDKLLAGNQESGKTSIRMHSYNTGSIWGVGVNFKTHLANTPSGITMSADSTVSISAGPTVSWITQDGFHYDITISDNNGPGIWIGRYTTVGNCIIGLDEAGRTFDHHCDGRIGGPDGAECGAVRTGLSLDRDLVVEHDAEVPGVYGLRTTPCPACGATEHFKVDFRSADERSQEHYPDTTNRLAVQDAQPFLIRRVQALLGLPVRP